MTLKTININDIRTGYGMLVSPDDKLGDVIDFFEDITDAKFASQWTHAGVFNVDPISKEITVFEMEAKGLEENDFIKNYKGVKTLVMVPKFHYLEYESRKFGIIRVGKIRYNFKQLFAFAGNALMWLIRSDKRWSTSRNDIMVCSEFQCMDWTNFTPLFDKYYGSYFGKKPSDCAMMIELFDYYLLEW